MATSCEPVIFDTQTILTPGDALIRCNGQDITKKGGKPRNRIMVIMPSQFAFPPKLQTDLTLGNMHKLNTESPELVIETDEGTLTFTGKYVLTTTKFMSIQCNPKKAQNACTDIFDRALVFDEPTFKERTRKSTSTGGLSRTNTVNSTNTEVLDQDIKPEPFLSARLGMSALSDPVRKSTILPSSSSSASRPAANAMFRTSSKSSQRSRSSGGQGSGSDSSIDEGYGDDDQGEEDDEEEDFSQPVRSSSRKASTTGKSLRDMSNSEEEEENESGSAHSDSSEARNRKRRPTASSAKKPARPSSSPAKRKTPVKSPAIRIDVDSDEDEDDASDRSSPKKRSRNAKISGGSATKKPSAVASTTKSSFGKGKSRESISDESSSDSDSDASGMDVVLSDDAADKRSSSRRVSGSVGKSLKDPSSSEEEDSEEESLQAIVTKGRGQSVSKPRPVATVKKTPSKTSAPSSATKPASTAKPRPSSATKKRLYSNSDEEEEEVDSDIRAGSKKKSTPAKKPTVSVKARSKGAVIDMISDSDASDGKSTKKSARKVVLSDHSDSDFEALLTTKVSATVTSPSAVPRKLVRKFAKSPSSSGSSQPQEVICLDD